MLQLIRPPGDVTPAMLARIGLYPNPPALVWGIGHGAVGEPRRPAAS